MLSLLLKIFLKVMIKRVTILFFNICNLRPVVNCKYGKAIYVIGRYNTLTQIVALNTHLISLTCYSFLQSLECIALPHIITIQRLYSSYGFDSDCATILQQAIANYNTQERNVVLQVDEIHVKAEHTNQEKLLMVR